MNLTQKLKEKTISTYRKIVDGNAMLLKGKRRYTGHEITLKDEIGGDNTFEEQGFEEQGYFLWENYCPKEIFDKCELTETREIKDLKKQRSELRKPLQPNLIKWKLFIEKLCKEKGQEIEKIWFNISTPFDNEIKVR